MPKISKRTFTNKQCALAAVYGGLSASIISMILWPIILTAAGKEIAFSQYETVFAGLLVVGAFSAISGVVVALVLGFPLIVLLDRMGSVDVFSVVAGASVLGLASSVALWKFSQSQWPLHILVTAMFALCSGVSCSWLRSNKSLKDAP